MSRASRLQSARLWLAAYTGKHVVRCYSRWFGVDVLCAARELQALGVEIPADCLEQLRARASRPPRPRTTHMTEDAHDARVEPISDDRFAHIAGYTPGGAPFGTTREELDAPPSDPVNRAPLAPRRCLP